MKKYVRVPPEELGEGEEYGQVGGEYRSQVRQASPYLTVGRSPLRLVATTPSTTPRRHRPPVSGGVPLSPLSAVPTVPLYRMPPVPSVPSVPMPVASFASHGRSRSPARALSPMRSLSPVGRACGLPLRMPSAPTAGLTSTGPTVSAMPTAPVPPQTPVIAEPVAIPTLTASIPTAVSATPSQRFRSPRPPTSMEADADSRLIGIHQAPVVSPIVYTAPPVYVDHFEIESETQMMPVSAAAQVETVEQQIPLSQRELRDTPVATMRPPPAQPHSETMFVAPAREMIQVPKVVQKERLIQKIVEEVVEVPVEVVQEEIVHIPKTVMQTRFRHVHVEEFVDIPVPQEQIEIVEVPRLLQQERMVRRAVEQVVEVPVPFLEEEIVHVPRIVTAPRRRQVGSAHGQVSSC